MRTFSLEHRTDDELRRDLLARFASERVETAELVAHIAEFDARGLHKEAGFDSMHDYCRRIGRLSEDAAYRRLHAARAARRFPCLFEELAEGRLNLSAICILAPHLTPENVEECVAAARDRSNAEIRDWLVAQLIASSTRAAPPNPAARQLEVPMTSLALTRVEPELPLADPVEPEMPGAPAAVTPDPEPIEFEMRFTMSRADLERFRYARALLSHAVPSGDPADIFRRAIDALITECESRKFAAKRSEEESEQAGKEPSPQARSRHIPARVKRAVWRRDQGRCTFVLPSGHRCGERRFLEFDHVRPVARGGKSSVDTVRLRCRAHNQVEAARALGADFMHGKRRQAALATAVRRALPGMNGKATSGGG